MSHRVSRRVSHRRVQIFPTGKIVTVTAVNGTSRISLKDVLDMAIMELQLLKAMMYVAGAAVASRTKVWLLVLGNPSSR